MATPVQRAALALVLVVAFADGELDTEEFKILARRIPDHPLFEGLGEDVIHEINLSIVDEMNRSSTEEMIARYGREIPPSISLQVFKLLLDMMYADGYVDRSESLAVIHIKRYLGISPAEFEDAVDRAKRRAEY